LSYAVLETFRISVLYSRYIVKYSFETINYTILRTSEQRIKTC